MVPRSAVAPFPTQRLTQFLSKVRIQSKDYGLIPFELLGTQRYVLLRMEEAVAKGITRFVILKARQLGMSTFFLGLDLFWAFENKGLLGAFITHTEQSKAQFRNILKVFLANLPRGYKKEAVQENRDMVVFENGSLFQYIVAGIREKGKGGIGRSSANNFSHSTEVAFWGSADDINELAATMSTHYPHRLEIFESTANGFNHFHEMVEQAKQDPTTCFIFVGWWLHDHYSYADDDPFFQIYMPDGHQTRLSALEKKRVRAVKEQFGVDITHNQIAWYRWQLEAKQNGDQSKMDELYPWTEDDAFVATGSKFFTNESLTDAMKRVRNVPYLPFRYVLSDRWHETGVIGGTQKRFDLKVWEEAHADGHYVIGCDPAYGSSDDADRSVIHVARCFSDRMVQVAEFVSTSTSTYQCAWVLAHLAGYYRNCMVNLEISGPGQTVFQELNHLRTTIHDIVIRLDPDDIDIRNVLNGMKHYLYRRVDSLQGELAYQWRTTMENKIAMMTGFKDAFELRRHIINSLQCLEEMKAMVYDQGHIEASGTQKDDRVVAGALAHEAWRRWVQPRLRSMGLSFDVAMRRKEGTPDMARKLAIDYLRKARIVLNDEQMKRLGAE